MRRFLRLLFFLSVALPAGAFALEEPVAYPNKIAVVDARDTAPRDRKRDLYLSRIYRLGIAELVAFDLKKVPGIYVADRDLLKQKLVRLGNRKSLEQAAQILGIELGVDWVAQVQFRFLEKDYLEIELVAANPREKKTRMVAKEQGRRGDLFKMLDRCVLKFAESLGHPVSRETRSRIEKGSESSFEAWHRFTRGMEFYYQKTQNSLILALEQFRQAEFRDILFLPTYVARARVYLEQAKRNWGPQRELYERAIENSRKALFIDSKYLDGYEIIAEAYFLRGRYVESVRESLKAIRVNPMSLKCRLLLVKSHKALGKPEEANREIRKILEIDPANPEARSLLNSPEN